ncbi:MAG: sigma-70 family RNA polymerase sigma factor [Planctomycetota bacterium]
MGKNDAAVALVQRCIQREPGAWREFVDAYAPTIKALARRYLRLHGQYPDESILEDMLQDVMVAFTRRDYKLLRNYDETYSFKTYLGVITRTEVHRLLRKKRPQLGATEELEAAAPVGAYASGAAEENETQEILAAALDRLPERDAAILRLRFMRDQDYRQIAEKLGMPEGSVGQTLHRAKRRLLDELKGTLDPNRLGV